jgi:hypothetical protein
MSYLFTKRILFALGPLMVLPIIFSCTKTIENAENYYAIMGNASGLQELPANSSAASATLSGTYDAESKTLQYKIEWKHLSGIALAVHFHTVEQSHSPSEVITIEMSTNGTIGSATATVILTDSAEEALLNGNLYYDIHTALYPDGEIRGEVIALHE